MKSIQQAKQPTSRFGGSTQWRVHCPDFIGAEAVLRQQMRLRVLEQLVTALPSHARLPKTKRPLPPIGKRSIQKDVIRGSPVLQRVGRSAGSQLAQWRGRQANRAQGKASGRAGDRVRPTTNPVGGPRLLTGRAPLPKVHGPGCSTPCILRGTRKSVRLTAVRNSVRRAGVQRTPERLGFSQSPYWSFAPPEVDWNIVRSAGQALPPVREPSSRFGSLTAWQSTVTSVRPGFSGPRRQRVHWAPGPRRVRAPDAPARAVSVAGEPGPGDKTPRHRRSAAACNP